MRSRPHSLSKPSAIHFALTAFVCVVMGLLLGSSPIRVMGTDLPIHQMGNGFEQIEAEHHTAVPTGSFDIRFTEDLPEEFVELTESTDDDETDYCFQRLDAAAFRSPTGLYESSTNLEAPTSFRLLAFPSRGSPSA
jgi:hypothetical protein